MLHPISACVKSLFWAGAHRNEVFGAEMPSSVFTGHWEKWQRCTWWVLYKRMLNKRLCVYLCAFLGKHIHRSLWNEDVKKMSDRKVPELIHVYLYVHVNLICLRNYSSLTWITGELDSRNYSHQIFQHNDFANRLVSNWRTQMSQKICLKVFISQNNKRIDLEIFTIITKFTSYY